MYTPSFNRIEDPRVIRGFIHAHGFATLVTGAGAPLEASHLPLLLDESDQGDRLRGHMARGNAQWKRFDGSGEALCIFHGPHAYISPSWYEAAVAVPTWNYATVHVYGAPRLEEDPAFLRQVVADTTHKYESAREAPWPMDLPEDYMASMTRAIVGFSVAVTRVEAKFKFGQNRSAQDQSKMLRGLEDSHDPGARELAAMIRAHQEGRR